MGIRFGFLLWDAELRDAVTEPALLHGYHRSFACYPTITAVRQQIPD